MDTNFYRETWAEVHLDAIEENVEQLNQRLPKETRIMAVVKADGYGHGAAQTAQTALSAGAEWLGVALLDEALELRYSGIQAPIVVLGRVQPDYAELAAQHNISLTVFQKEWLEDASRSMTNSHPLFLHMKLDTGMGRIGIKDKEELADFVSAIKADRRFVVEGAYTHFATADEIDEVYFEQQYERFEKMLSDLQALQINPNLIHCGNSAASLRFSDRMFDMVRFGISMYGLSPSEEMKPTLPFSLKQAFALRSQVIHVKEINPGETISYGATYQAQGHEWIGTVPIGYADGWVRRLSGRTVFVQDEECPIVGRICMDQLMIRLDQAVPIGTEVTLIGRTSSGNQHITVDEVAKQLETINYEVPCMITNRVPRIYFYKGEKVQEKL